MYQNRQQNQTVHQSTQQTTPQQTFTVQHDFDGTASVTSTIAHAISDISGINVSEAESAMQEYMDLNALDRLFSHSASNQPQVNSHVTFNIIGYQTTLYRNGLISIVSPDTYQ